MIHWTRTVAQYEVARKVCQLTTALRPIMERPIQHQTPRSPLLSQMSMSYRPSRIIRYHDSKKRCVSQNEPSGREISWLPNRIKIVGVKRVLVYLCCGIRSAAKRSYRVAGRVLAVALMGRHQELLPNLVGLT